MTRDDVYGSEWGTRCLRAVNDPPAPHVDVTRDRVRIAWLDMHGHGSVFEMTPLEALAIADALRDAAGLLTLPSIVAGGAR